MLVLLLVILDPLLSILHFLQLPADIYLPIHWDISGKPDFWVDKELFFICYNIFYCFTNIILCVLLFCSLFRDCESNLSATRNITVTMMLFCF